MNYIPQIPYKTHKVNIRDSYPLMIIQMLLIDVY